MIISDQKILNHLRHCLSFYPYSFVEIKQKYEQMFLIDEFTAVLLNLSLEETRSLWHRLSYKILIAY